ncbi:MAG: hypothetical protein LUC60_08385, partial [Lachnospiraceae bacterium]|nr:hypothetical protein [Lachnospiraceae bacterium]
SELPHLTVPGFGGAVAFLTSNVQCLHFTLSCPICQDHLSNSTFFEHHAQFLSTNFMQAAEIPLNI